MILNKELELELKQEEIDKLKKKIELIESYLDMYDEFYNKPWSINYPIMFNGWDTMVGCVLFFITKMLQIVKKKGLIFTNGYINTSRAIHEKQVLDR